MAMIQQNFDQVDSEFKPVAAGVYTCIVEEILGPEPTKDGKGTKVAVTLRIDDESSPMHGRKIYEHIGLKNPVMLKQLALSCGVTPGSAGLDTADLVGKTCRVRVKNEPYKDPSTGVVRDSSAVAEHLFDE